MTRPTWAAAGLLAAAFLLAYLPDVGHGFISDDFTWLVAARAFLEQPSLSALTATTNFLRPVVTLSFAANLAFSGADAWAFGATNLMLALLCALLLFHVCRSLALAPAAAVIGAASWAFNFHGINMAVLWISGRTSLAVTMFALLTALCVMKRRAWAAALFCGVALFAKEEAIALPFILVLWVGVRAAWPLFLPLMVYFAVRLQTSAFWPQQAPDYYRFTTDVGAVATNAAHYLDRAGTVFAGTALVLLVAARALPNLSDAHRRNLMRGLGWFAGGYALTLWVPVRSSLYAVFPSVGSAVMLATVADAVIARSEATRLRRAAIALLVLPFLLLPVYRARNVRWVELADLTRAVVPQMQAHADAMHAGAPVWISDDDTTRANIRNAFGGQMDSAMELHYGVRPQIVVSSGPESDIPPDGAVVLALRDAQLQHR